MKYTLEVNLIVVAEVEASNEAFALAKAEDMMREGLRLRQIKLIDFDIISSKEEEGVYDIFPEERYTQTKGET